MIVERIHSGLPRLGSRLERIARAFSDNSGVDVGFHGGVCATDGRRIILPVKCANLAEENMDLVWSMLDHEAEHVRQEIQAEQAIGAGLAPAVNSAIWEASQECPRAHLAIRSGTIARLPSAMMTTLRKSGNRDVASWLNVVEDVRIVRIASDRFVGVAQHLTIGRLDALDQWRSTVAKRSNTDQLRAAIIFGAKPWAHDISWLSPKVHKALEILEALVLMVDSMSTYHDAVNLAICFADAVKTKGRSAPKPPPKPPEPEPELEPISPPPPDAEENDDGVDGGSGGDSEGASDPEDGDGGEDDADGPGECEDSGSESPNSDEPGDGGDAGPDDAPTEDDQNDPAEASEGDDHPDGQPEDQEQEPDGEGAAEDGTDAAPSGDAPSEDEDEEGVGAADEDGDEGPGDSHGGAGEDDEPDEGEPEGAGDEPGGGEPGGGEGVPEPSDDTDIPEGDDASDGADAGGDGGGVDDAEPEVPIGDEHAEDDGDDSFFDDDDVESDDDDSDEDGGEGKHVAGPGEVAEMAPEDDGDGGGIGASPDLVGEPRPFDAFDATGDSEDSPLAALKEHLEKLARDALDTADTLDVTRFSSPYEVIKHDRIETLDFGDDERDQLKAMRTSHQSTATALAGRLRTLLLARAQARRMYDQDHGKLDRRSLHGLNRPGHLPNRNVFHKTIPGQTQDVAVTLFVDCSGSMHGRKISIARSAAALLGDTMVTLEPLGVKWSMVGFTTDLDWLYRNQHDLRARWPAECSTAVRLEPLIHQRVKGWDDNWRIIAPRVAALHAHMQNADADSIRWAVRDNLAQKASRHIVLVMSDGQPAVTGDYTKQCVALKAAVKESIAAGVEVQGLGITDSTVKLYYPVVEVVNDIAQLPEAVLKMSRGWFHGRRVG